jgi:triphosphoribosyl-dephospho-CoA synthase
VPSIGLSAQLACIWEATARKPGNVHPFRSFVDTSYLDFLASAAAIAPVLEPAPRHRLGETVLEAVRATRKVAANNTNLGIVLLLAPLAACPDTGTIVSEINSVLERLDVRDSQLVFQAIRLAGPAGLGRVPEQDISEEPTRPLRDVMGLAADRDLIARQYANGFREVLEIGVPAVEEGLAKCRALEGAIVFAHLRLLAVLPDSLVARKCSLDEALEASRMAQRVLELGWPETSGGTEALTALDDWLRAEGNARNPGTTADLVAASLFVALRQGIIKLPLDLPWVCARES